MDLIDTMNFGELTSKLRAKASSAAVAARSFQGFDTMAANDEYIHSDSLNVKRKGPVLKATASPLSPASQHSVPADAPQEFKQDTPSSSQHSVRDASFRQQSGNSLLEASSQPSDHHSPGLPLLSVVQTTLSQHTRSHVSASSDEEEVASLLSKSFHTGDESDNEEEDDPILNMLRDESMSSSKTSSRPKKNTNRFLEDLENRMARPQESAPESTQFLPPKETNQDSKPSGLWLSVLRNGALQASSKSSTTTPQTVAPWSKPRKQRKQQQPQEEEMEPFEIVASDAMLGQDELEELAQLKQAERTPGITRLLWRLVWEHPRESFILFTLLLGAFSYFYSRREVVEDDVHR